MASAGYRRMAAVVSVSGALSLWALSPTAATASAPAAVSVAPGPAIVTPIDGSAGPAAGGAAASATPAPVHTLTMRFQFVDAPVEAILNEMSARFGFIIIKPAPVPGRITVHVPEPLNARQAVNLLNSILIPMGYAVIETHLETP